MKFLFWFWRFIALSGFIGLGLGVYSFAVEPVWLQVRQLEIALDRLSPAFEGYRLVFVSDLHVDEKTSESYLRRIVQTINRQNPDLILLGGDTVTGDPAGQRDRLIRALSAMESPGGVIGVLGNHDHWQGAEAVRAVLSDAGVRELANEVLIIERARERLYIAGLDDVWVGAARLDETAGQIPPNVAAVLLVHEPDIAGQVAATGRFGLQLSGHSHGGQINLPFIGPPVLPYLGASYPAGLAQVGELLGYTTRGTGTISPRARFNCRPEITVIDLVSSR